MFPRVKIAQEFNHNGLECKKWYWRSENSWKSEHNQTGIQLISDGENLHWHGCYGLKLKNKKDSHNFGTIMCVIYSFFCGHRFQMNVIISENTRIFF